MNILRAGRIIKNRLRRHSGVSRVGCGAHQPVQRRAGPRLVAVRGLEVEFLGSPDAGVAHQLHQGRLWRPGVGKVLGVGLP